MRLDEFFGLGALADRLRADMRGSGVHAYLIVGPRGTGKMSIAAICARALNCAGAQKPCDECAPCRRALNDSHPDIIRVTKTGASIGVDEIRALIARVSQKPFEGGSHAVIVEDADSMTPQAQNALLKTLETPPGSAVFFLTAERLSALLPTIQSRCRIVRTPSIDADAMRGALGARGVEPLKLDALIQVADGSVGKALELYEDKNYWALRERVVRSLSELRARADVSAAAALLLGDKDEAIRVLEIIEQLGRAKMRVEEGIGVDAAAGALPVGGEAMLRAAIHAKERMNSNVVWQNVLENMLFQMVGG